MRDPRRLAARRRAGKSGTPPTPGGAAALSLLAFGFAFGLTFGLDPGAFLRRRTPFGSGALLCHRALRRGLLTGRLLGSPFLRRRAFLGGDALLCRSALLGRGALRRRGFRRCALGADRRL